MNKEKKKIVVVGDACTGKTALLQMFTSDGSKFPKEYEVTKVCHVSSKIVELEDDKDIELIFFDISGKEMYRSAAAKMVRGVKHVIMVFDCSNQASFTSIESWVDFIKKANENQVPSGLLVSTKNDLQSLKTVSETEGQRLASKHNLDYVEVSYRDLESIETSLSSLAKKP